MLTHWIQIPYLEIKERIIAIFISRTFAAGSMSALTLCICMGVSQAVNAQEPTPRNILFIAVDDLRNWVNTSGDYTGPVQTWATDAGDYQGRTHTPNIDALAAVSTRYLNAYAAVPHCVGSRATVLMGLSPETHQITHPSWHLDSAFFALYNNEALKSLPEVMSQNGYYTAASGKVFSGNLPSRWSESGPYPVFNFIPFDPGPDNTFFNPSVFPDTEEHPDQTVANWAAGFIATYDQPVPFFLAAGFNLPHIPWQAPQWAYDLYPPEKIVAFTPPTDDLDDEPDIAVARATAPGPFGLSQYESVEAAGKSADYTRAYLASISHSDAMVGEVLKALASSPHANNTDIILWSDHGYHSGEKFYWRKNTLWEQSARTPLFISSPGNPNYPIADITSAVSLLDLAPTVLDLAGIPPFPQFEGVILGDAADHGPVQIFWLDGVATVHQDGTKFIDYDLTQDVGVIDQAHYNLITDPGEQINLFSSGNPVNCPALWSPTIVSATPGNGQAAIAFTAGTAPLITDYQYNLDGGAYISAGTSSPFTIADLTNGTEYSITLTAMNDVCDSVASSAVSVTPAAAPAAPTSLSAAAGDQHTVITFVAGADNGSSITNYQYSLDGVVYIPLSPAAASSPITIRELTNGTFYTITLQAINGVGTSGPSAAVYAIPPGC
jgi:arylsulfatase A-like enzyme